MKALVFHDHGDLSQIALAEIPAPEPGPDDVLLSVKAAALNRLDLWVLAGWPGLKLKLPHVLGSDGAGVVAAVGERVTHVQVGDRVAVNPGISCGRCTYCISGQDNLCTRFAIVGEHMDGFAADQIVVPARNLVPLPEHVSFASAASASLVYVTAWHSLITVGKLRPGESVLIVGAGGGVNTASIQIARLAGAGRIYVVGSSDEKLAQAQALGADVLVNRHNEDWGKAIYKATHRQGVDIVVDNVGAATFKKSLRALRNGGRLLTVGNTSGPTFEIDNRYIFNNHLRILGSSMGPHSDYEQVIGMVFDGRLNPVIDTVYPLADGLTALQRLQAGDVIGKLVLTP